MALAQIARGKPWTLTIALATALSAAWLTAGPAAAEKAAKPKKKPKAPASAGTLEKLDTSLRLVPANAAFYSSMLRNREQVEAVLKSRAWARLMEMPAVQMGLAMLKAQSEEPGSPVAQAQAFLANPQFRQSIDLAQDMVSHEIFVYGDKSFVGFADLAQQLVGGMRYGPMMLQATGRGGNLTSDEIQGMLLFSILAENLDLIRAPDLIIGFKLKDKENAETHLRMLEDLLTGLTAGNELLKDRIKRQKVGGHEYLTLSLDGSMVPWDEAPIEKLRKLEANEGDVAKVIERLKKTTVVVSLGVRGDYLLLAVGSSTDCLARLGQGKLLAGRAELRPLEKFADKKLTSISYLSNAMMAKLGTGAKDIDDLLDVVKEVLPAAKLGEDKDKRILGDAAALAEDLKTMLPKPGAAMAFTFMTDRGMEGYAYDWTENTTLDGSKPLSLLEHVGGSPILAWVSRSKVSIEGYDLAVKWIKTGFAYFEEFAKPQIPEKERGQYEKFIKKALPLAGRMDKANRELLFPALADGQGGLVIDARLTSKQFHQAMPPMEKEMPMVEPALIFGVSDAKLLVRAMAEYREVANGLIDLVREVAPQETPAFAVPEPKSKKIGSGTVYFYPLPGEWGLDKKILPNAGLSDTVAVVTASQGHTERLLKATPLAAGGVLAGASQRKLATAVVFDWARMVDAAAPWVDFAATMIVKQELRGADEAQTKQIMDQVHTVLDVLKCLKSVTAETYVEDGVMVTHSLTEIRDMK
jgi:hypothetical protein